MPDHSVDIVVIGGGPAGLATALACAHVGVAVKVVAPPHHPSGTEVDLRTTALIGPSIDFLNNINAWAGCSAHAAPIRAVRIADDRGRILRAPETMFRASELGLKSFGANVPNSAVVAALETTVSRNSGVSRIDTAAVTGIEPGSSSVRLQLREGGVVAARLVVAADGRRSLGPPAAGIKMRSWTYPQAAVAGNFSHSRPHEWVVNELHRLNGPLTTVPLPGLRSSLVWVEAPEEAQRLAALAAPAFAELLEERLQGVLGTISNVSARAVFPLAGATAGRMGARRIALVGEAAHLIPPIGAQGLNLGLRDAAALAQCIAEAKATGRDVGDADVLDAYHQARAADVAATSATVDLLNRSLLADLLAVDVARGASAHLVARSDALRGMLMRAGLGALAPLPQLMRRGHERPALDG